MKKKEANILIIDDDEDILFAAKTWLKKFFTQVETLSNPKNILQTIINNFYDVILLDMNYRKGYEDGQEGLYWLKQIQEQSPETSIIVLTAHADVGLAVECIKMGAIDFILKPWNNEKLYTTANIGVETSRRQRKITKLTAAQETSMATMLYGSKSEVMKQVPTLADKISPTDANVLILGKNGTGKYVLAKYIHDKSQRAKEPFVHIDLGAIPETLFESELFGHAKGAFTDAKTDKTGKFEAADGGTLFLDEIANVPLMLQSKLLSAIQNKRISRIGETKERAIDVRIICATNAPIVELVQKGSFRQDLLFRINTVELTIPSLSERKDDIADFANLFIERFSNKYHKNFEKIDPEALKALKKYSWPGNIRELENVMERAVIIADGAILKADDLNLTGGGITEKEYAGNFNLEQMEERLIQEALKKHKGNISLSAQDLGISRTALYRRMEKYKLI